MWHPDAILNLNMMLQMVFSYISGRVPKNENTIAELLSKYSHTLKSNVLNLDAVAVHTQEEPTEGSLIFLMGEKEFATTGDGW